jgi:hypothetical protein
VTRVERFDWPVKVQLLLDNGIGLGGGSIQPPGWRRRCLELPENVEVTIVGTAPQPRFLARDQRPRGYAAGHRAAGLRPRCWALVESLFEATQRIERDAGDFFPSSSAWPISQAIAT